MSLLKPDTLFKEAVRGIRQVSGAVEALWVTELKRQGTTYSSKGQAKCLGKVKNKCKRAGLKVIKNVHRRLQFLPFTVIAMSSMLLLCDLTFDAWCRNITSCSKLRLLAGGLGVDSPAENLAPASTGKKKIFTELHENTCTCTDYTNVLVLQYTIVY